MLESCGNAEDGGISHDTRPLLPRTEHQSKRLEGRFQPKDSTKVPFHT